METELNLEQITRYYAVLGLSFTASLEQIRRSRNKLLMQFHPDRNPKGWIQDDLSLNERVQSIQEAYLFITDNYDQIIEQFEFLHASLLTSRTPYLAKSHWVYTEVSKMKLEED